MPKAAIHIDTITPMVMPTPTTPGTLTLRRR